MPSNKRIVHLLPAGIAGLGATLAIVVSMVGTAAAAVVVDTGSQDYRGAQDLGLAPRPAAATSVDTGSHDYRGTRDLQSAAGLGATSTSAPKITEALQLGQTISTAISNTGGYNAEGRWVPGRVGETVVPSIIAPPVADGVNLRQARIDPAHEHLTIGTGSDPVHGATPSTPASRPAEAPQPGQTGW